MLLATVPRELAYGAGVPLDTAAGAMEQRNGMVCAWATSAVATCAKPPGRFPWTLSSPREVAHGSNDNEARLEVGGGPDS
jgi:hypothetical protein